MRLYSQCADMLMYEYTVRTTNSIHLTVYYMLCVCQQQQQCNNVDSTKAL